MNCACGKKAEFRCKGCGLVHCWDHSKIHGTPLNPCHRTKFKEQWRKTHTRNYNQNYQPPIQPRVIENPEPLQVQTINLLQKCFAYNITEGEIQVMVNIAKNKAGK